MLADFYLARVVCSARGQQLVRYDKHEYVVACDMWDSALLTYMSDLAGLQSKSAGWDSRACCQLATWHVLFAVHVARNWSGMINMSMLLQVVCGAVLC